MGHSGDFKDEKGKSAADTAIDFTENSISVSDRVEEGSKAVCPSHTTELKLLARIDIHVIPFLCVLWLLAFLDRVNIANAAVFKLREDLKITTGTKYNTALVIFFVPYVLFEIPANILMKRCKPHRWLAGCLFFTGVVACLQGLTASYSGLLAARFFLGLAECNMLPGAFYVIGMWYKRSETQKRFSFFFNSASLAGAFGGLLAAAIGKMQGLQGYNGWRWIFIIEGAFTALAGVVFYFFLPDFPEQAKWLTKEERAFIQARLLEDQGSSLTNQKVKIQDVLYVFKDYKIIVAGIMYFGCVVTIYGYAYFSPLIIRSYKYSPIQTQLHSVPPWAAAFGLAMTLAWLSDRLKHRFLFAFFATLLPVSGYSVLLTVHNNRNVQYGALFLVIMGTASAMPIIIGWFSQNLGGHLRRSVGLAYQISFGNLGAFVAVYAFLQKDAPRYKTGFSIGLSFMCLFADPLILKQALSADNIARSSTCCCLYAYACWSQNKTRKFKIAAANLTLEEVATL
ncbi:MAG: hypothetical protein M1814_004758 [Vezdaea aestivalis]|nr:MAG: hypothetical protein M1814_004758 [Vezdaea aestivalis]